MPNPNPPSSTLPISPTPRDLFEYLKHLTAKGGPEFDDYDELTACFHSIGDLVRLRQLSYLDGLTVWWKTLGEAFSSAQTMQGWVFVKPHSYSGDFEIIEQISQYWKSPKEHLYRWDYYFQEQAMSRTLRYRKGYLYDLVEGVLISHPSGELHILNTGCGAARDVKECLQFLNDIERASFDCLDKDKKAIAFAKKLNKDYLRQISFSTGSAFNYGFDKEYDLVWSAGGGDYLDDETFCLLFARLFCQLKEGGELAMGSFSENNPSRDYMEALGWFMNHRTEGELFGLARKCGVPSEDITIEAVEGNLFLRVGKGRAEIRGDLGQSEAISN